MLNNHVTSTVTLSRLNSTRCSPHLDGYTDWLVARRYTAATIELFLFGIIPLGQWLTQHDMPVSSFDHRALEAFRCDRDSIGQWRHTGGRRTVKAAFVGARRFHEYLVIKGHVESTPSASSLPKLLEDFAHWLQIHKGTRVVTVENHIYYLRKFVASLGDKPDAYDAIAVRGYLQTIAKRYPMPTTKATFGSVRVFLRYLVAAGLVTSSLPEAIPVIRDMRLASLPQYIVADDIKKLIDSCDCMPLTARRDRAVLLILARLALRASDVAMLNITDVDWRGARLRVGGKNRQQCWLPLPQDVGDALVG
ncbi:tyrosine-type recombinase/integrase [Granulosicoccus antarcticus]|uniref:Tyrosine recombinase XerC n=1 Tax=Granulosicoccus antarcticus IMCC3135 TaxID=1192854 RepID=A0A2Z2NWW8_9GAMM|nr:tyrosine-type recombinase/integrase [Granulosicoccus antarcticus]ASJ71654.1 Tyrosine recombinase XerC [Granulosicoccus antarcticus IMCC3135]